uniref:Endonuclease/exonuclease/phosphatase domain-containing protein n=1 Tax=Oryza barthii TaxID=65489 RepID=A0A0D3HTB1_9ORYZ
MKRFFQPVPKDGSPAKKRPAASASSDSDSLGGDAPALSPAAAACAIGEGDSPPAPREEEPRRFVTWNANSLLLRMKSDWPAFCQFVSRVDPDVICVQEVRMPAAGSKGAPKNPGQLKDDTSSSRDEKQHEPDGRVIIAEFESFLLLNTYAPNNGWKEEENSFQRRRKWDKRMLEFVQQVDKPLIWCGDLNVSHEEIDVSHPDFFSSAKLNGYIPPNKEDCGQPGFTLSERRRFGNILSQGKLVDAYRYLHKEKDMDCGFSWSGHPIGKYRGKRMRIDYFLVSEKLKDQIVSCDIHGRGIELEGFYGSDHCPVSLELSEEVEAPKPKSSN